MKLDHEIIHLCEERSFTVSIKSVYWIIPAISEPVSPIHSRILANKPPTPRLVIPRPHVVQARVVILLVTQRSYVTVRRRALVSRSPARMSAPLAPRPPRVVRPARGQSKPTRSITQQTCRHVPVTIVHRKPNRSRRSGLKDLHIINPPSPKPVPNDLRLSTPRRTIGESRPIPLECGGSAAAFGGRSH